MPLAVACALADDAAKKRTIDELYSDVRADFPAVQGITPAQLSALLPSGDIVLVDVRPEVERAVSMIPGAISSEEFEARASAFQDRQVITYCTIGYRSAIYARDLQAEGFDVRNLEGSLLSWAHAEGELVNEAGPTRRIHVFGPRWNLAPEGYEPVW